MTKGKAAHQPVNPYSLRSPHLHAPPPGLVGGDLTLGVLALRLGGFLCTFCAL